MYLNMHKERINGQAKDVAVIRLKGFPYQQEMFGVRIDCSEILEDLTANSAYEERLSRNIALNEENLKPLFESGYYGIDAKIKKAEPLTYPEAFSLMTFVSMGVNKLVYNQLQPRIYSGMPEETRQMLSTPERIFDQSIALLSAMSAKEAFVGLTPEEIAGLTAAALEIDTIVRIPASKSVLGIGGMGGDRGYKRNGDNSKLFSLSTMGAIVASNFGYVHKHHSYPNTSKVAGQSAIEAFGAMSNQSTPEQFVVLQESTQLIMTSCHTTRLIHTLSHRLKGETINHIVGPLAIPVDKNTEVNAFIGANDNVHPETIIDSLIVMQKHGVQRYGNSVSFCGLNTNTIPAEILNPDTYYKSKAAKSLVAIDEVAPPPYKTLAAFMVSGINLGTFVIESSDFMEDSELAEVHLEKLLIPNTTEAIMKTNQEALTGADKSKSYYLAMTAALGLFTKEYASKPGAFDRKSRKVNRGYLRHAFKRSLEAIYSGQAYNKLVDYAEASRK